MTTMRHELRDIRLKPDNLTPGFWETFDGFPCSAALPVVACWRPAGGRSRRDPGKSSETWMLQLAGEDWLVLVRVMYCFATPGQGWVVASPPWEDQHGNLHPGLYRYCHATWLEQEEIRKAQSRQASDQKKPAEWRVESRPNCLLFATMLLDRWRNGKVSAACLHHLASTLWQMLPEAEAWRGKPATRAIKDGADAVMRALRASAPGPELEAVLEEMGTTLQELQELARKYPDCLRKCPALAA